MISALRWPRCSARIVSISRWRGRRCSTLPSRRTSRRLVAEHAQLQARAAPSATRGCCGARRRRRRRRSARRSPPAPRAARARRRRRGSPSSTTRAQRWPGSSRMRPVPVTSAAPAEAGPSSWRVARAQPVVALVQLAAQQLLDRARGRHDDGEAERVDDADVAGQVDDAEHLAGVGIHHRRGGARPALDGLGEVLGGEDLHRVDAATAVPIAFVPAERLAPQRALDEVHVVGGAVSQLRVALDAEQQAVGVGDDEQVVGVEQGLGHALLDERADGLQRVLVPHLARAGELDDGLRGQAPAGVDAGFARAPPGVGDRAADIGRAGVLVGALQAILDEVLPGVAQLTGPFRRDRVGIDGDPGAQGQGLTLRGTSCRKWCILRSNSLASGPPASPGRWEPPTPPLPAIASGNYVVGCVRYDTSDRVWRCRVASPQLACTVAPRSAGRTPTRTSRRGARDQATDRERNAVGALPPRSAEVTKPQDGGEGGVGPEMLVPGPNSLICSSLRAASALSAL